MEPAPIKKETGFRGFDKIDIRAGTILPINEGAHLKNE
jgi:hypothetical protein